MKLGWKKNRAQRIASIVKAQRARGAEITELNNQRWGRPGEREKLSQRNREAWADPEQRRKMADGIRRHHQQPEVRRFYSDMRRAMWRDPEYRRRVTEIIQKSHRTAEYRALFGRLLRERWRDPEQRKKMLAACRRNLRGQPKRGVEEPSTSPAPLVMPEAAPPPAKPETPLSAARRAEMDAIAEFLAKKGALRLPSSREAIDLPGLTYDPKTRKYRREQK